jgi:hypothetical protein
MIDEVVEHQLDPNHPLTKHLISPQIKEFLDDQTNLPKLDDPSSGWQYMVGTNKGINIVGGVDFNRRIFFRTCAEDSLTPIGSFDINSLASANYCRFGFKDFKLKFCFKLTDANQIINQLEYLNLINRIDLEVGGCVFDSIYGPVIQYLNYMVNGHTGYNFEVDGDNFWLILNIPFWTTGNQYIPYPPYQEIKIDVELNSRKNVFGPNFEKYNDIKIEDLQIEYTIIMLDANEYPSIVSPHYLQPMVQNQYQFVESSVVPNSGVWRTMLPFIRWLNSIFFCIKSDNKLNNKLNNRLIKESVFKKVELKVDGHELCRYNYNDLKLISGLPGYYVLPFTVDSIDDYSNVDKNVNVSKINHLMFTIYWDIDKIKKYEPFDIHIGAMSYNVLHSSQGMACLNWFN